MTEVRASHEIPAGKAFVWDIITDFENYRLWHPFATISGVASKGEKIEYSFNVVSEKFGDYGIQAQITSSSPLDRICWTFGLLRIFVVEEWISTTTIPGGTRVEHGMRFEGPLASLFRKRLIGQAGPMLEASVRALARHVTAPGAVGKRMRVSSLQRRGRLRRKRGRSNTSGS